MSRSILIFVACFVFGATIALVVRAALHHPYAEDLAPAAPPPAGHQHHGDALPVPPPPPAAPGGAGALAIGNTICPVCGSAVDASLPTSRYRDRVIGFGCAAGGCKAKFDADPERFGPAALADRKAE